MAEKEIEYLKSYCRTEGCSEKDIEKDTSMSFLYDKIFCQCFNYCEKVAHYTDGTTFILEPWEIGPVYEEPEQPPIPEDEPVPTNPDWQEAEGTAPTEPLEEVASEDTPPDAA